MSTSVRVICRFRPFNKREIEEYRTKELTVNLDFSVKDSISITQPGMPKQNFTFDAMFDTNATQKDVYEKAAKQTIVDVLAGFNGTIFAYGQTGAGKTFTMLGPEIGDPEQWGIIPRSSEHIFQAISEDTAGNEYTLKCSYLEIYKEQINDLLDTKKKNLAVHENPSRGVYIDNLTEEFIASEEDIVDILNQGGENRAVSATAMNQTSSRSHSVFILYLTQKTPDGSVKAGKLNLVDLAGSEKVDKTGAKGETLEEAKKINQSLSALGNCIHALTEKGRGHVPFRDSKLTRILQESLGGNCKTTLLCACSPHDFNIEETISTLKFAARAKTIKTMAKLNAVKSAAELLRIIDNMKREMLELKLYAQGLEKTIEWMKSSDYAPGKPMPFAVARPGIMEGPGAAAEAGPTSSDDDAASGGESSVPATGQLSEKLVELESLRAASDNRVETLTAELSAIKDKLAQKEQEFSAMQTNSDSFDEKIAEVTLKFEDERKSLQRDAEQLKYKLSQKDIEAEEYITELDAMNAQIDKLTADLSKLAAERDAFKQQADKISRESQASIGELAAARQQADEASARAAGAASKAKELEAQIQNLKGKTEELELENEDLHEFVAQVEAEKEQALAAAADSAAQVKLKAQQVEACESSIKASQARAHEFEAQVAAVEAEKATLLGKLDAELKKLRQAAKDQETALRQVTDKCARLESEAATYEEGMLKMKTANADLENTIAALQKSNATLRSKTGDISSPELQASADSRVDQLTRQLKQAMEDRQREASTLNGKYTGMISNLEEELRKVQRQRDDLQQQIDSDISALKATARRAEEEAKNAQRRAEAAESDLESARHEASSSTDAAAHSRAAAERLQLEKATLEARVTTEEARLQASLKRAEDLSEEIGALRAANDDLKQRLEKAQRASAGVATGGSPVDAARLKALEASLADSERFKSEAEAEARKEREAAAKYQTEAAKEAAKNKSNQKKLDQQNERISELMSKITELEDNHTKMRLDVEVSKGKLTVAEKARDEALANVARLEIEVKGLDKRVNRATRLIKPLRSTAGAVAEAFAAKEDIAGAVFKLRTTQSKFLAESREQSSKAAMFSSTGPK